MAPGHPAGTARPTKAVVGNRFVIGVVGRPVAAVFSIEVQLVRVGVADSEEIGERGEAGHGPGRTRTRLLFAVTSAPLSKSSPCWETIAWIT